MVEKSIDHIFFIDSLNFSFWPDENQDFSIDGEIGYWALCAAIKRALDEKIPIINPEYYGHIEFQQLRYLFRTDNGIDIPMLNERVSILNENGAILIKVLTLIRSYSISNYFDLFYSINTKAF